MPAAATEAAARQAQVGQIQTWLDANDQTWFTYCQEHGELKQFHCPLNDVPMSDPVEAEDGYSYNRVNLAEWMANISREGKPSISPLSGEAMGEGVTENDVKREGLLRVIIVLTRLMQADGGGGHVVEAEEWQTVDLGNDCRVTLATASDEVSKRAASRRETLSELREAHLALEPIRKSLGGVLDPEDWKPPNVTVVGTRSAGKSTILERLVHLPLFPRAPSICNKMPFHVLLRQSSMAEAKATICVKNVATDVQIGDATIVPMQNGVLTVNTVQVSDLSAGTSERSALAPLRLALIFVFQLLTLFPSSPVALTCCLPTFLSRNAFYRRTLPVRSALTRRSCSKCTIPMSLPSILSTCLGWRRTKNMAPSSPRTS
jgi:hypothetical protein